MASISDMCWTSSEDLFQDLDLDALYVRQLRSFGAQNWGNYPYMILVHTGRIAIGINLGHAFCDPEWAFVSGPGRVMDEPTARRRGIIKEPSE